MAGTMRPIRPSAAIRAAYDKRLRALINEMHRSIMYHVKAGWRANEPEEVTIIHALAQDSAASALDAVFHKLRGRWLEKFDDLARSMATRMVNQVHARNQRMMLEDLRNAGFTVKFQTTAAMREAMDAIVAENVNLIRSIPEQYLARVQTITMQSVSRGRDLEVLAKSIEHEFGVTKRKAANIALDQNNKATASLRAIRERELGITTGIWRHSGGGKVPRASHKAFSGKEFDLAKGHDFGDGFGHVLPGQAIACRCYWVAKLPF